jgi:hypothetical protein
MGGKREKTQRGFSFLKSKLLQKTSSALYVEKELIRRNDESLSLLGPHDCKMESIVTAAR